MIIVIVIVKKCAGRFVFIEKERFFECIDNKRVA